MAQFIQLMAKGSRAIYIRASSIERVEADAGVGPEEIAPPDYPINIFVRDNPTPLPVFGCTVMDILLGIHRDDVFLDLREP